jgi:hypothetical protein
LRFGAAPVAPGHSLEIEDGDTRHPSLLQTTSAHRRATGYPDSNRTPSPPPIVNFALENLTASKATKVAGKPVKFQFGFEYSVVSQDDFGTRFQVKLNVIPVIASLIKSPIFGGN